MAHRDPRRRPIRRVRAARRSQQPATRVWLLGLGFLLVALPVVLGLWGAGAVFLWSQQLLAEMHDGLIAVRDIESRHTFLTTHIYDRDGRLLYEIFGPGKRTYVPLEEIPPYLTQAIVAAEDDSFWTNQGVDFPSVLRAAYQNLRYGRIVSGGSTITQQLIRHIAFSPQEARQLTLERKIKEAALAWLLTRTQSKEEILELYLNEVYFGSLAYGVQAASRVYFDRPVRELDLAESALLAGLVQAPAILDPFTNEERALARRAYVLSRMLEESYITPTQARQAGARPLRLVEERRVAYLAPHFVEYVRQILEERFGQEMVRQGGLAVRTSLDLELQEEAERIVREQIARIRQPHHATNGAALILRPQTGEILAMVGSADFADESIDGQVNVTLRERQPGSSIKPVTYAAALEMGYSPAMILWDAPTTIPQEGGEPYQPRNYDRRYRGPVNMRTALANSYNVPAVKLLERVGVPNFLEMAHRLGIQGLRRGTDWYGLSITLGGGEVTLLDLVRAYATLANLGQRVEPVPILEVTGPSGRTLFEAQPRSPQKVLDPRIAYILTDFLDDDAGRQRAFGTDNPLALPFPAAAKTGTTDDFRDNWTVGYTPGAVVGVWVGNSDNSQMINTSGITGAAPIWSEIMRLLYESEALADLVGPPRPFELPQGLIEGEACYPGQEGCLPVEELYLGEDQASLAQLEGLLQAGCQPERVIEAAETERAVLESLGAPLPGREAEEVAGWLRQHAALCAPLIPDVELVQAPGARYAIQLPQPGEVLTAATPVAGTVQFDPREVAFWKVEFSPDGESWITIGSTHTQQVAEGELETLHAQVLPVGEYQLQLVLVKHDGNWLPPYRVPIVVGR